MTIVEIFIILILGWPAMIASLLIWLAGLIKKKFNLVIIAGIVILPFAFFYIGGYIGSHWLGLLFTLGHFASAFSLYRSRIWLAWLFLLPYVVWMSMLAYAVLSQPIR
jgi:hypothetical protein